MNQTTQWNHNSSIYEISTSYHIMLRQYRQSFPNFSNVTNNPASNYAFKVSNRNIRTRCKICSKLTIKILERAQWHCSSVFIVNSAHISHLVLVFPLLLWASKCRLRKQMLCPTFKIIIPSVKSASWDCVLKQCRIKLFLPCTVAKASWDKLNYGSIFIT